ncbi:hypothetical protein jhhlp_007694 [Lomentospora prolificans]|uniref:SNF7 family protein n=1 Tax=Lomentospora prolificans TaxID=41688 RepID=A0A2N3N0C0_9PEZI|nr:hypothetical protein jhhlp_007694 [Lomentospora prolificans]
MGDIAEFLVNHDHNFRRARLPALYSDFRSQRTLNPDGFQANVTAWREALARATRGGRVASSTSTADLFVLPVDEHLLRGLEYKQYGRPLALGSAVSQAVSDKQFIPLVEFLRASESIYHRSWMDMPKTVVSWAFDQLWPSDGAAKGEVLPRGQFVVLKNVEEAAKAIAEYATSAITAFDFTFTKSHFYKKFSQTLVEGHRISRRDLDVLLKYASRDKGIIAYDGKTVRIRGCTTGPDSDHITEEDSAIASLNELTEDIRSQTTVMEERIDELTVKAKDCMARKNKISALALLKSKKLTEAALEKRHATLTQLEEVAHKIQQAGNQAQLVEVIHASTGVLRVLNQQVGGAERVEQAVDKLREQMDEVDELGNVLADAGSTANVIDEAELDDELERLEAAQKSQSKRAETETTEDVAELERRLDSLPVVPSTIKPDETEARVSDDAEGSPTKEVVQRTARLSLEDATTA